jgi:hypothetical protein
VPEVDARDLDVEAREPGFDAPELLVETREAEAEFDEAPEALMEAREAEPEADFKGFEDFEDLEAREAELEDAPELEARASEGATIVSYAEKEKGLPYVWGGGGCKGPSKGGFDCSGKKIRHLVGFDY